MTLPKKQTRTLKIEGRTFRWRTALSHEPEGVCLTVEDVLTGEIRCRVETQRNVTPSVVREFIHYRFL